MRLLPRRRLKPLAATVMGCDACCRATEQVSPCRRDSTCSITCWMPCWFECIGTRRNTEASPHISSADASPATSQGSPTEIRPPAVSAYPPSHLTHASVGRALEKFRSEDGQPICS